MSRLFLAPMEGLADALMRDTLTRIGGFDACVSEFIRVTGTVLPDRVYAREAPEVLQGARTAAGTPMVVQLLGSDPESMARNAQRAALLSPHGIDLNFGCPAKVVNLHGGGATLLADPFALFRIVRAVRQAVPPSVPVTAKMRLGVSDKARAIDCAVALEEGGAASLVVHARTRDEGYRPPAHWEWIARIDDAVSIPVVANGDVWTAAQWRQCRAVSGCQDVMIGRGAVSDPFLAQRIRGTMPETPDKHDWQVVLVHLDNYLSSLQQRAATEGARHEHGRIKKWLSYLQLTWPQAGELHLAIRRVQSTTAIRDILRINLSHSSLVECNTCVA